MLAFASDIIDDDSLTLETLANYLSALGDNIADFNVKNSDDPLVILEELIFQLGELEDQEILEGYSELI